MSGDHSEASHLLPSAFMEGLGKRIARARGALSQAAFARRLGIHKNTLANYEQGKRLPDAEVLAGIVKDTGVSLDWLLWGTSPLGAEASEASPSSPKARGLSAAEIEGSLETMEAAKRMVAALLKAEHLSLAPAQSAILEDLVCSHGLSAPAIRRVIDLLRSKG